MNHAHLPTLDLSLVDAALDAWAGEHGFLVELLAIDDGQTLVRLAPHPHDLTDLIRCALGAGNTPADWEDQHAPMDGSSASWDWAVTMATTYNRTRIIARLSDHDQGVRGLFAHHGHPGPVEIQILEVDPAQVLHHLTGLKNTP